MASVPVEFAPELYRGLRVLFSAFGLQDLTVKMAHLVHGCLPCGPDLLLADALILISKLGLQSDLPLL